MKRSWSGLDFTSMNSSTNPASGLDGAQLTLFEFSPVKQQMNGTGSKKCGAEPTGGGVRNTKPGHRDLYLVCLFRALTLKKC